MSDPTEVQIRELIESNGPKIESITEESSSVYAVRLANSSDPKRYVKIFSKQQSEEFLSLAELGQSIGMPENDVFITDEFGLQMMMPAEGTLLSHLLPKYLLPGVWGRRKDELQAAMYELGRYLRTLHKSTCHGQKEIPLKSVHIDSNNAVTNHTLNPIIRRELAEDVVDAIKRVFSQHTKITVETSLIHGDMILRHIYYKNKDITLIDFDRVAISGCLEDCVSFECTLTLMISRLPYARNGQFKQLINSFYEGYGKHISNTTANILKVIKYCSILYYYIRKRDSFLNNPSIHKDKLIRDIDVYILKQKIRYLADDIH